MSQNAYSVTISTHSKASTWKILSKEEYKKQKELTQEFILEHFLDYFDNIKKEQITKIFSATSMTFQKFIGRQNCGGKAINVKSILQTPSCKTPFKGLYNVGDTIFAGQGWPGVALGASILNKELNEEF
jgi:phytoene dehydrogenase-like protein